MPTAGAVAKSACASHRHGDRAKQRLPWALTLQLGWTSQRVRQKRPTFSKNSPTFSQKSPTFLEKSPTFFEKRRRFFCVCPRFVPLLTDSAWATSPRGQDKTTHLSHRKWRKHWSPQNKSVILLRKHCTHSVVLSYTQAATSERWQVCSSNYKTNALKIWVNNKRKSSSL